jgi:hypothetical protein
LLVLLLFCQSLATWAQTDEVFARVILQKVEPGKEAEYEKMVKETMKPVHQLRKQSGKIIGWYFYKVHFTGTDDAYNYVSVYYYDAFEKSEANEKWADLIKQSSPKSDPEAYRMKLNATHKVVSETLYFRSASVTPKTAAPVKFIQIDFMKLKPGMYEAYMKVEKEDWKPVHQALADDGKSAGWRLWQRIFPGGADSPNDFATSTLYSSYKQLSEVNYGEAFKKVYPETDIQPFGERTDKARNLVRTELWEMIDFIQ